MSKTEWQSWNVAVVRMRSTNYFYSCALFFFLPIPCLYPSLSSSRRTIPPAQVVAGSVLTKGGAKNNSLLQVGGPVESPRGEILIPTERFVCFRTKLAENNLTKNVHEGTHH